MSTDGCDKGMEVIAEDGRMIKDEDEEILKEGEDMEDSAVENRTSEDMSASSERGT